VLQLMRNRKTRESNGSTDRRTEAESRKEVLRPEEISSRLLKICSFVLAI
jgi:hypothetical protein